MSSKEIELKEIDGHLYLEFDFNEDEDMLLLEFDLVTKEDEPNVL